MPDFFRKPNRLTAFDYSTPSVYFITICATDRKCIFRQDPFLPLTEIGKQVDEAIISIPNVHTGVFVDQYVIMPNHVHLILFLSNDNNASVSVIIQQMKRIVSLKAEQIVWQKSFHDHVIRNERSYQRIRKYITDNPKTWSNDCFYSANTEPADDIGGD